MIPDELRRYIHEQLARIEQLRIDADRKRQDLAPWRVEVVIATIATVGVLCGALGYKIGATPPAPIVIQLTGERR